MHCTETRRISGGTGPHQRQDRKSTDPMDPICGAGPSTANGANEVCVVDVVDAMLLHRVDGVAGVIV